MCTPEMPLMSHEIVAAIGVFPEFHGRPPSTPTLSERQANVSPFAGNSFAEPSQSGELPRSDQNGGHNLSALRSASALRSDRRVAKQ
jgi:hypothetical protein